VPAFQLLTASNVTGVAVTVIGVSAIVGAVPMLMFNIPPLTEAVVGLPAAVTLEILALLAVAPPVTLTLEAVVDTGVNVGNVFAVKVPTSVIISVLLFKA